MEPIIVGKDIEIIYNLGKSNEFHASRKVSFEIYPEEFIILFGPSGCGKSTILYCLLGVLPYTYGSLMVKGKDPYRSTAAEIVEFQRNTVGIVYQAFFLIQSLNVLDNITLPMIFANVPPEERRERGMKILTRFGVDAQAYKLPATLSGGQQQRVAVSRSLINDPEILLADEPVGNLDSLSTKAVMDTLQEVNERDKKTVILVTHDAKHLPYAHRVYHLKDGEIIREVINPMKRQIKEVKQGEMVFTEVDKLARIFPYSTPEELRVKSIENYLTQGLNFEQLERLDQTIEKIIAGKIEKEGFLRLLTGSFEEGGVGVKAVEAETMADRLYKVLEESRDIARYRRERTEGVEVTSDQKKIARRLRTHLLDEYDGEVTPVQLKRIEEAVEGRLDGTLTKEDFQAKLNSSVEKNGVGFRYPVAKRLTFYMEKMLAQGLTF
jgi:putative ABC transport system ATP-binding protein